MVIVTCELLFRYFVGKYWKSVERSDDDQWNSYIKDGIYHYNVAKPLS